MAKFRVTWKRSAIGQKERHKATIRALGLRRLNQTVLVEDTSSMRGMLERVKHLVSVEYALEEQQEHL